MDFKGQILHFIQMDSICIIPSAISACRNKTDGKKKIFGQADIDGIDQKNVL